MDKKQPEEQATCTNSDSWNCKYCNKTKTCAAITAQAISAEPAGAVYAALRSSMCYIAAFDPDEVEGMSKERLEGRVRSIINVARSAVASRGQAPAQPAAQQGVAYAALPEKYYLAGGEVPTWDAKQMHAFADATHAIRASNGQAPAGAGEPTEQQILEAAFAPAQPAVEASRFGSPELQAMVIARCVEKDRADSVLYDPKEKAAESVPAPAPPPECETEAEKRAFAFGWFKALESERMKADNKKKDPL